MGDGNGHAARVVLLGGHGRGDALVGTELGRAACLFAGRLLGKSARTRRAPGRHRPKNTRRIAQPGSPSCTLSHRRAVARFSRLAAAQRPCFVSLRRRQERGRRVLPLFTLQLAAPHVASPRISLRVLSTRPPMAR